MAITLRIKNFEPINLGEQTQLSAEVAPLGTSLPVYNSQNFVSGDFIFLGQIGSDQGEVVTASTVSTNTAIPLSTAIKFTHNTNENVIKLFGDSVNIYRANNVNGSIPDDADFVLVDPLALDYDQVTTDFIDTDGDSNKWYKVTYLNSVTTDETALSDSAAVRPQLSNNYCTIADVKIEAGLVHNRYITDNDIDAKRQAAQDYINGKLSGIYVVPFEAPFSPRITLIAARLSAGYILTSPLGGGYGSANAQGKEKITWAENELNQLREKGSVIIDSNGDSLATSTVGGFSMYPDSTTSGLDSSQGGKMFTVEDRY